ncbi:MAG: hypothetical protein RIT47_791 [Pseudomonadota bacterium]|jgi:hypothetical protein
MKALEIQQATHDAIFDERIMAQAEMLLAVSQMNPDKEMMTKMIFAYSSMLAAMVASNVTQVLLTEQEFEQMTQEINEFEQIRDSVLGGDN